MGKVNEKGKGRPGGRPVCYSYYSTDTFAVTLLIVFSLFSF